MKINKQKLIPRMKAFRLATGLRQTDVSYGANISLSKIQRYDRGQAEPTILECVRLAHLFGCRASDLAGDPISIEGAQLSLYVFYP